MTTLIQINELHDDISESTPRVMIVREGTELAETLRANGWIARAGWRTTTNEGQSVWHLRFEIVTEDEAKDGTREGNGERIRSIVLDSRLPT